MKIVDWDQQSMSLIIKFSSDVNSFEVDDAIALAYQPLNMFPGITDTDELLKKIAVSGIDLCEREARKENAMKNASNFEVFENLKGQEFEYDVNYLLNMHRSPPNNDVIVSQPTVEPEDIYVC